jgi:ABC-2 type transport system ATP-binding protein
MTTQRPNPDDYRSQLINAAALLLGETRITAVIGHNGCGKTTLLDFIADTCQKALHARHTSTARRSFIYQLQHPELFPSMNVNQCVSMYQQINSTPFPSTAALSNVGEHLVKPIGDTKLSDLSGGERQIAFTYCTCQLERDLYLFDEPTAGVDPTNSKMLMYMIDELSELRNHSVIITTHNIEQLSLLSDPSIVTLAKQEATFQGHLNELMDMNNTNDENTLFERLLPQTT